MATRKTSNTTPASNPDVGMPATVTPTPSLPRAKTMVKGSDLVPDFDSEGMAGVRTEYRYWVGVTPSCPVGSIDLAGINFPKINEKIIPSLHRDGTKSRVPVIGALVFLTEAKFRLMKDRLPRTVIRFTGKDEGVKEEPGTGQNLGDAHRQPRKGHLITIPTAEDVASAKKRGRPTREYIPHKDDVPAARFMFAQICADQEKGSRGDVYPDPLEVTGLEWPDEIEEQADFMTG